MPVSLLGWEWILFFVLLILFVSSAAVTTFIILGRLRWPFRVVILESPSGNKAQITGRDRARLVVVGDGGEEIWLLKNRKKYKAGVGKRIGNKQIAWHIGDEGYWYNVDFGDFNKSLLEVGLRPLDRNVRLATSSMRKSIDQRYQTKTWMDKYGNIIYFGMFILVLLAFAGVMWFAFDKQLEIAAATQQSVETSKETMEIAKQVLSSIENIKLGGSGLITSNG